MNRKNQEKANFLKAHVPGLRNLPRPRAGRADVTYFFNKAHYPRGYTFLTQGVESEETFIIVQSGQVEILRHKTGSPHGTPTSQVSPSSRPGSAAGSKNGESSANRSRGTNNRLDVDH